MICLANPLSKDITCTGRYMMPILERYIEKDRQSIDMYRKIHDLSRQSSIERYHVPEVSVSPILYRKITCTGIYICLANPLSKDLHDLSAILYRKIYVYRKKIANPVSKDIRTGRYMICLANPLSKDITCTGRYMICLANPLSKDITCTGRYMICLANPLSKDITRTGRYMICLANPVSKTCIHDLSRQSSIERYHVYRKIHDLSCQSSIERYHLYRRYVPEDT
ncbi:unnamed protein product [Acanthosepion pharaonis]|uniref:Uncharacterized protein n=1 Tax=Acanthosepion pharaonis TaxID=158019 RepID=A0A812DKM2_ACAPH|nr:unnamed protein product [Sepia pharaonis]